MSTTGDILAGTGTSVARGAGTAWTNPGNITANDGTTASCTGGSSGSAYLRASNFAFNIPANSLIQGFTVKVEMAESSTGAETVSVQIVGAAGTAIGTAKTFSANGTALTIYTTGTATDLWGTTGLTATDVNDTDFGVYVWYTTTHNTTVDQITIDVNYEPPRTGTLAATETGTDTASINGDVIVQGSLSVAETGLDTLAIQGVVVSAAATGSLSATELGNDTASINGDVFISGSLAATETGTDSASLNGTVGFTAITGSLAATEVGADSAVIAGKIYVLGSLAATEAGLDVAMFASMVDRLGQLNAVEVGSDSLAVSGAIKVLGSMAVTESGGSAAGNTYIDINTGRIVRILTSTTAVII